VAPEPVNVAELPTQIVLAELEAVTVGTGTMFRVKFAVLVHVALLPVIV
jgi:hypothetical protein